jgi:hypothetical protein
VTGLRPIIAPVSAPRLPTDADEPGCPWLARYSGLGLAQVIRLARLEQRPLRILGVHARATTDWLASRLTVVVDSEGHVLSLHPG